MDRQRKIQGLLERANGDYIYLLDSFNDLMVAYRQDANGEIYYKTKPKGKPVNTEKSFRGCSNTIYNILFSDGDISSKEKFEKF